MNHRTDIRGKMVLSGTVAATLTVIAILAGCCLSSPDRAILFHLYQSFGFDGYGLFLWPALIAAAILIALGAYRLLHNRRLESETTAVKLLPGLIGAILSTAFGLMVTPANSFINLQHPQAEVSKMAWLTLLVFCLLFVGLSISWLLFRASRQPKPVLCLCSSHSGNLPRC